MTKVSTHSLLNDISPKRKAIVAFYASLKYGSEYRAGAEFIRFAASAGFDLAVIANLEQNAQTVELGTASHGISVVRIESPVVRQRLLYRFSDFIPQTIWHRRVARYLKANHAGLETVWIQNGALPWLPIAPYARTAPRLIWGPIGGGETLTSQALDSVGMLTRLREKLRQWLMSCSLRSKKVLFSTGAFTNVIPLARTACAQQQLQDLLSSSYVPIIPEILEPVPALLLRRLPTKSPRFVWVGQNIPRKNLSLAIKLFKYIQQIYPQATLDVYGVDAITTSATANVRFHGWVSCIDWSSYRDDGVLLLTSFREGLPSVILEAVREGLLCITSDVGSVASLGLPTVHVLPMKEYPHYSEATLATTISCIRNHLSKSELRIGPVSYRQVLLEYLRRAQA